LAEGIPTAGAEIPTGFRVISGFPLHSRRSIVLDNMERLLLVQIIVIGVILLFAIQFLVSSDKISSHRWVKIRVKLEDNQRQLDAPPEKEPDQQGLYTWLVLAVIVFFFILLLANQ
jgi:hypothetical protein